MSFCFFSSSVLSFSFPCSYFSLNVLLFLLFHDYKQPFNVSLGLLFLIILTTSKSKSLKLLCVSGSFLGTFPQWIDDCFGRCNICCSAVGGCSSINTCLDISGYPNVYECSSINGWLGNDGCSFSNNCCLLYTSRCV